MARRAARGWRGDLPQLELECMQALWANGDLTVREVRAQLQPHRPLAYTTILTVLGRLAEKGAVTRRKSGRAHLYHALYSQAAARQRAVSRLLEQYFGGSRELLLEHLAVAPPSAPPPASSGALSPVEGTGLDPTLL